MIKSFTCILVLLISIQTVGQDSRARLSSLENKLEILKIETKGLEESLNISITQTTLPNFLLAIGKVHKLNIHVAPDLNSISIINNFPNVEVADVLLFLAKEYDLTIEFTGNILSFSKYIRPQEIPKEKEILVAYSQSNKLLTLDLQNDRLDKVFRKIMDVSGKNLLFAPELANKALTIYLKDVPFDSALDKLAKSNELLLSVTNDGFYTFESAYYDNSSIENNGTTSRPRRKRNTNFYYRVLDTLNKKVEVNLQNTPIADVIYTLGEDLQLDIFTATPLDNLGTATVEAKNIHFDELLDNLFESIQLESSPSNNAGNNQNRGSSLFTYKREGNIYFFGTEDQLSLKQVEVIGMMHRSIQLLDDPSGGGQRRAGRNNFNSNQSNFFPNSNNFNQNQSSGNRNNSSTNSNNSRPSATSDIQDIIPEDIKEGLDIKIDTELNSFIVSGPGVKVERFKDFVKFIDKPVPVIIFEVMILEVNRSAITETGISFGLGDQPRTTTGEFFPSSNVSFGASTLNKLIGSFSGFGSLNIGQVLPNFYLDIKAMESAGTLKVKSTPKLATINGHKAYLTSGETTYYAVTSQTFFGVQNPQTSEITNYAPIDAELSLEILPFVSGDGQITLDIQVVQSAFNGERIAEDAPPGLTSREFSSILRMRDQDVAVLGGIETIRKDDSGSGVPLLARIPIIKYLFSKRRRESTKRDLTILIKPTIID